MRMRQLDDVEGQRRDYARRVIREQVEVVSLVGNVALDQGEPRVHAYAVVARSPTAAPWEATSSPGVLTRPSRS